MNAFYHQMFNTQYVNQEYYMELQKKHHEQEQQKEILNAMKAMRDLCQAVKKIDHEHQQQAFNACLFEFAKEMNW